MDKFLKALSDIIPNQEKRKKKFFKKMKPKIIHTKTFHCDDDHPIVYYTFDNKVDSTDKTNKGYVVCEYCYTEFIYKEKIYSEEMQDKLEPTNNYANKILKGSG